MMPLWRAAFRCLLALPLFLLEPGLLHADEQTRKLAARLSEEADAFARLATQLLSEETLQQTALKPPPRFRPRMGDAARKPPQPTVMKREIRSEYSFATFSGEGGAIHELRQVTSVDGKRVQDAKKAEEALARIVTASDDQRKKQLLKDFAKHGLYGAVTDFGQLLLLFAPREIARYEFSFARSERLGERSGLVFSYKQIDGPKPLTVVDARRGDRTTQLAIEGEVWVYESDYQPAQVTMAVNRPAGSEGKFVREEAAVRYAMSSHGVLVPISVQHREVEQGRVIAENNFRYGDFKRFGASSDLKFDVEPEEDRKK